MSDEENETRRPKRGRRGEPIDPSQGELSLTPSGPDVEEGDPKGPERAVRDEDETPSIEETGTSGEEFPEEDGPEGSDEDEDEEGSDEDEDEDEEGSDEDEDEISDDEDLDDEDLEDEELDPDEAVDVDEPDEDAPVLRHDEYIDPEERAKLEEASAELEREDSVPGMVPDRPDIPYDKLDIDAAKVIYRLRRFNHESYFVGGCVRDLLLGLSPKDFDLATSARPEEIKKTFTNCRLIGRRFRLAHVYFRGGKVIETATFRRNPRQEDEVEVEEGEDLYLTADNVYGSAEEDARRRDFTINALFYDPTSGKVIDFVEGRQDLEKKLIRTVGDPSVRMPEDPVRILRAVRFAAKLGFQIEEDTWLAMKEYSADIPKCPAPRVTEEILRLLRSGASRGAIALMRDTGALRVLLPPIAEHLEGAGSEGEARFFALLDAVDEWGHENGAPPDDAVLLAALLSTLFDPGGIPTPRSEALDELLTGLFRDARLPRRLAERVRLVLGAQRVFAGQRKRRFSSKRFMNQSYIHQAMALFDIRVRATGEELEAYKLWVDRMGSGGGEEDAPAKPASGAPRRRRRRRGGGRNRPR